MLIYSCIPATACQFWVHCVLKPQTAKENTHKKMRNNINHQTGYNRLKIEPQHYHNWGILSHEKRIHCLSEIADYCLSLGVKQTSNSSKTCSFQGVSRTILFRGKLRSKSWLVWQLPFSSYHRSPFGLF